MLRCNGWFTREATPDHLQVQNPPVLFRPPHQLSPIITNPHLFALPPQSTPSPSITPCFPRSGTPAGPHSADKAASGTAPAPPNKGNAVAEPGSARFLAVAAD